MNEQESKHWEDIVRLNADVPAIQSADAELRRLRTQLCAVREALDLKQMYHIRLNKIWEALSYTSSSPCAHAEEAKRAGDGVSRIAAERIRQKSVEGLTPEHDEQHGFGELSIAAACYALNCRKEDGSPIEGDAVVHDRDCHDGWPWSRKWDKRGKHSRERSLEIAGALIAAELDRIAALREVGK